MPRGVKVGDIFYTSWGYEQTNLDFYQVVGLVGKVTVKLRKIAKDTTEQFRDAWLCCCASWGIREGRNHQGADAGRSGLDRWSYSDQVGWQAQVLEQLLLSGAGDQNVPPFKPWAREFFQLFY